MTQIELIAHHSQNLVKVISSHGADSEYTTHAFFSLQAAKMGMGVAEINEWATKKCEELHQETLDRL